MRWRIAPPGSRTQEQRGSETGTAAPVGASDFGPWTQQEEFKMSSGSSGAQSSSWDSVSVPRWCVFVHYGGSGAAADVSSRRPRAALQTLNKWWQKCLKMRIPFPYISDGSRRRRRVSPTKSREGEFHHGRSTSRWIGEKPRVWNLNRFFKAVFWNWSEYVPY